MVNQLLYLVGGVTLILEIGVVFARRADWAVPVVVIAALLEVSQSTPHIVVGGVTVGSTDVMTATLLVALAIRAARGYRPDSLVMTLLALLTLNVVRGSAAYGLQASFNQGRGYLYFFGAAGFFSTFRDPAERSFHLVRTWWVRAEWVLAFVALAFLARHGFSSYASGNDSATRPLVSGQALMVLEAGLLAMPYGKRRGARQHIPSVLALAVVLLSAQRTVWVATGLSLAVLAVMSTLGEASKLQRRARVVVGTSIVGLSAVLLIGLGPVSSSVDRAYSSATEKDSTFSWRVQGWVDLIDQQRAGSGTNLVLGDPLGAGYTHRAGGQTTKAPPHSVYVSTLVDLGLVGLGLLVALFVRVARRLRRRMRRGEPLALVAGTLAMAVVAHGITYNPSTAEGALIGIILAVFAATARPRQGITESRRMATEEAM
jgi:O-antigen ligase